MARKKKEKEIEAPEGLPELAADYDETTARVFEVMREEQCSLRDFGHIIGLAPQTIHSQKTRGTSMPISALRKLLRVFPRYSVDWLLYGEGPRYTDGTNQHADEATIYNPQGVYILDGDCTKMPQMPFGAGRKMLVEVPLYRSAALVGLGDAGLDEREAIGHVTTPSARQGDIAIEMRGQAMTPKICDGDVAVLRERDTTSAFYPDRIYTVVTAREAFVGTVVCGDGELTLCCANPAFPVMRIAADEVRRVYVVVGHITPFRYEEVV
jgi:hypothetical protein